MQSTTHSVLEVLFEGAPGLVMRCQPEPGESVGNLLNRAEEIARSLPEDEQNTPQKDLLEKAGDEAVEAE